MMAYPALRTLLQSSTGTGIEMAGVSVTVEAVGIGTAGAEDGIEMPGDAAGVAEMDRAGWSGGRPCVHVWLV